MTSIPLTNYVSVSSNRNTRGDVFLPTLPPILEDTSSSEHTRNPLLQLLLTLSPLFIDPRTKIRYTYYTLIVSMLGLLTFAVTNIIQRSSAIPCTCGSKHQQQQNHTIFVYKAEQSRQDGMAPTILIKLPVSNRDERSMESIAAVINLAKPITKDCMQSMYFAKYISTSTEASDQYSVDQLFDRTPFLSYTSLCKAKIAMSDCIIASRKSNHTALCLRYSKTFMSYNDVVKAIRFLDSFFLC